MRLRTLIELLAALILTFAAIFAVTKMARTTGMTVDNAYARGIAGDAKTGPVYITLNNVRFEPGAVRCTATDIGRGSIAN